ncbi:MAG: hypothetical protein HYZ81_10415 [Nitrospinae bacterium]|nr:hypothetical protein [Nitrospinota bacterium]
MTTQRTPCLGRHTVAWVAILVGLLGSASPAQPVLLSAPLPLSYARYRVALETPQTIFQWQDAAVVVRVQNGQGLLVDGIPVTFQVDPAWARYASIRPARALTQGGRARATLRADRVGLVWFTVRVGAVTQRAAIAVVMPIATAYGPAVRAAHERRQLTCPRASGALLETARRTQEP